MCQSSVPCQRVNQFARMYMRSKAKAAGAWTSTMRPMVPWQCLAVVVCLVARQGEAFSMTPRCAQCSKSAMQNAPLRRQGRSCGDGISSRGVVSARHRARHCSRRGQGSRDSLSPLFAEPLVAEENRLRVEEEVLDVAIVGAGPAGLALAIGMRSKGLRVKVFEAAPEMADRGAAVFVQVNLMSCIYRRECRAWRSVLSASYATDGKQCPSAVRLPLFAESNS